LILCFVTGIVLMICGCIAANIATQQMRRVLNENRAPEDQLRRHDASQEVAQNVIDMYRAAYPDDHSIACLSSVIPSLGLAQCRV